MTKKLDHTALNSTPNNDDQFKNKISLWNKSRKKIIMSDVF